MIQDREALSILKKLNQEGFEAYIVGGCVRDMLMGKEPCDYDITTSARPEDVMHLFRCIPTGLQHGTVTVRLEGKSYEVTTFRRDGVYEDHRRPKEVSFATSLVEDLKRRDFTVNAIAMDQNENIYDPFDGQEDIRKKIIRAVGNPDERMEEDALRIMRGLRFASTFGFSFDEKTEESIRNHKDDLKQIAVERIQVELKKLLLGENVESILINYVDVLGIVIPELLTTVGFEQHNPWHNYTLYEHIVHSVGNCVPNCILRYTMLFHDLGKVPCYFMGDDGVGHFIGHGEKSATMAKEICHRLKMDRESTERITTLIRIHDYAVPTTREKILKMMHDYGEDIFLQYLDIRRADSMAQSEKAVQTLENVAISYAIYLGMLENMPCYQISMLQISGKDVMEQGYHGKQVGEILENLLQQVMDGKLSNEKNALLQAIRHVST